MRSCNYRNVRLYRMGRDRIKKPPALTLMAENVHKSHTKISHHCRWVLRFCHQRLEKA